MDEITVQAGVSKPTVYRHYVDKSDLFGAVVRAMMERLDQSFHAWILAMHAADEPDQALPT